MDGWLGVFFLSSSIGTVDGHWMVLNRIVFGAGSVVTRLRVREWTSLTEGINTAWVPSRRDLASMRRSPAGETTFLLPVYRTSGQRRPRSQTQCAVPRRYRSTCACGTGTFALVQGELALGAFVVRLFGACDDSKP
jgi:hypothetical protein